MRFSVVTLLTAVLAGTAIAAPSPSNSLQARASVEQRSVITAVGNVVGLLNQGIGVTELESILDGLLGQNLSKLEEALGVTFAEKLLGLSQAGAEPGIIQAVGQGVGMLLQGTGISTVEAYLDAATGGTVTSLTEILGVTDIEKALGIAS